MPRPAVKKLDIDPNYCNNVVLRQAARRMGQLYDDVITPSGMRATQNGLLSQISYMNEPTMKELADALVMDLSALGHALKPMTRDGWVELVQDEKDRRSKRVRLTEFGTAKLEEAMVLWKAAQDGFEAAFGATQAEELRRVLSFIASEDFAELFRESQAKLTLRS